ncbi:MAG TPA: cytochrome P450 [Ensifer sp.]|nr:cytochrome P450 [Ensifer sp.]
MSNHKLAIARSHIPARASLPFVGHALSVPRDGRVTDFLLAEAEELGPIFRLRIFNDDFIMVSGSDLVAELSDGDRFVKSLYAELVQLRDIGGDGLFTAYNDEPNWRKAHNILMPAFTREAMRGYHGMMVSAARSLIGNWQRRASRNIPIDVSQDMARLTFDTIGLCGFGHDFDSFNKDEVHPFLAAMFRALVHAQAASGLPKFVNRLRVGSNKAYANDIASMQNLITALIERRRREEPLRTDDLLGRMLNTVDPISNEPLDDANIRNQVVTFLIAGHETTGAALSFALYYLTKHPAVLARAQREVDALWGTADDIGPSYEDVGKLRYIQQILEEALRLWPTAPGYAVTPIEETVIGGRYRFRPGDTLVIHTPALHRQPEWGANVHSFDPERFSPEAVAARPGHIYKPFGNGERACIGRQFALHEATLVLGMLVHKFHIDDPTNYQLKIETTLTIKPGGFMLRPMPRTPAERHGRTLEPLPRVPRQPKILPVAQRFSALSVFHGSNLGTSAGLARELATTAADRGVPASVAPLDDAVGVLDDLQTGRLMVLVASSYNGRPTDDARRFVEKLDTLKPGSLAGLSYAILGVGDRTYAATYQRIPTLIDERLSAAGATPVATRGALDVGGNFSADLDTWLENFWDAIDVGEGAVANGSSARSGEESSFVVMEPVQSREIERARHHGLVSMTVLASTELVDLSHPLGRSKRFLQIQLPEGVDYRTGDHLALLPSNHDSLIERVGTRFQLDLDQSVRVKTARQLRLYLPEDRPVTRREILRDYVELQQPVSRDDIRFLAAHCPCPPEKKPLEALASLAPEEFERSVTAVRTTILDLLERYRSIEIPFELFLARLPAMSPRRYSISSSNVVAPTTVDLMVSVVDAPHWKGGEAGERYHGVASNYLAQLRVDDTVFARVVPCNEKFRLSTDQTAIVIGAGTGLAPFRGMIGDRTASPQAAPLIAYFGCDHPDVDFLHRTELETAEGESRVTLRPTFTYAPVNGHKFVQERMLAEATELWALIDQGAQIRVCGDATRLGAGVDAALLEIYRRCSEDAQDAQDAAQLWLERLRSEGRYVSDVW